jgi:hypothetical protein
MALVGVRLTAQLNDEARVGSCRLRPLDLQLAMLCEAVTQVEVDEALIRYAGFFSHALEILNNVF